MDPLLWVMSMVFGTFTVLGAVIAILERDMGQLRDCMKGGALIAFVVVPILYVVGLLLG